jgi:hypothetical protein
MDVNYTELLWFQLSSYLPLFKHHSFREEKEWRIILHDFSKEEMVFPIKYRTRNNIILPYLELKPIDIPSWKNMEEAPP